VTAWYAGHIKKCVKLVISKE